MAKLLKDKKDMKFLMVNPNTKRSKAMVTAFSDCIITIDIEEFHTLLNRKPYLITPLKACKELEHFIMARAEGIIQG